MSNTSYASQYSYARGCFEGLLVGDAAGATLEFFHDDITDGVVRMAMAMPGGGALRVGPGQITDDSELALSLARALLTSEGPHAGLPLDAIATGYATWFQSGPFDIGRTCRNAFALGAPAARMMRSASQHNMASEANGALMRIAPLAIWATLGPTLGPTRAGGPAEGHGGLTEASDDALAEFARLDAMLSHPSQVCQDCNAVYVIALSALIRAHAGSTRERVATALRHVHSYLGSWQVHDTVSGWLAEAALPDALARLDCTLNMGHVRYAFTMAFHFLSHFEMYGSYERVLFETLLKGGDTDTNAAIVGAMAGAIFGIHGTNGIPRSMADRVFAFDCTAVDTPRRQEPGGADTGRACRGHGRPAEFSARNALDFIAACFPM